MIFVAELALVEVRYGKAPERFGQTAGVDFLVLLLSTIAFVEDY